MRKQVLFLAVLLAAMVSCKSVKEGVGQVDLTKELPTEITYSNGFSMFYQALIEDMAQTGATSLKKYTPSEGFVSSYGLQKDGKDYVVNGFLHIDEAAYDASTVNRMITVDKKVDGIYNFSCPLKKLPELFQIKGVKRIETSQRLNRI